MRCSEIAAVKCQELTEAVKKALSMTSSLTTTKYIIYDSHTHIHTHTHTHTHTHIHTRTHTHTCRDNIGNSILESKRDEEVMEVMVVVRSEGESDDKEEEEEEVTYLVS